MRLQIRVLAVLAAVALATAGCSRAGGASAGGSAAGQASAAAAGSGSFADLGDVCHPGSAAGATDQGVTSGQVEVGVLTDVGFTKDPSIVNAAHVFTSWCNAAGGIDGRRLVADVHDTEVLNVVSAMTAACGSDFTLAGGSAALDGLAVKTRLECLLPDFDAQTVMPQNNGSDLQVYPITAGHSYAGYTGYDSWLLKQAYPGSRGAVGILSGQSSITQVAAAQIAETLRAEGGTVIENASFPITGVTNWLPYAEAVKDKGVKGLTFLGTPEELVALEQSLYDIGYKLDWIDANTNAYAPAFIQLAGKSLTYQHNYADLPGVYPLEKASGSPAVQQVVSLFAKYAPGQPVDLQVLQAFSAWLVFADSAETCGSALTRRCVYEAALKQTAWTGGGLTAPVDLARPDSPPTCFDVEEATPAGWQPAPFGANNGPYRCGEPAYRLTGSYPQPLTLADVGKNLSDLK